MKKIALFLVSLFTATFAFAYDVEIDGIYYNLDSHEYVYYVANTFKDSVERTATVTSGYNDKYSGDIVIPEKVTYNGAEYNVTSIGWGAFKGSSYLTSVTIPNSITSIGYEAFQYCHDLTSIVVDENNEICASIDGILYDKQKTTLIRCPGGKTSVEIPNSVTEIGYEAFLGCYWLTSVTIPNSVTSINYGAFNSCESLTSVSIPESVTYIGNKAFEDCENLRKIEIGSSIKKIGDYAFSDCNLVCLTIMSEMPPIVDEDTFEDIPSTLLIVVPYGSSKYYKSAEYWSDFTNYEEMSYLRTLWEKIKSFFGF